MSILQDFVEKGSHKILYTGAILKTLIYSKTCVKRPLKNRQKKIFKTNGSLMKVENIAECSPASLGAFCNTFDLH